MHYVHENIDVAIRTQHPSNEALQTTPLFSGERLYFTSPEYLNTYGTPKHPNELREHRCIMHSAISSPMRWQFKNNLSVPINPIYLCNSISAMIEAAKAGVGIAHLSNFHIRESLKKGELVEILKEFAPKPIPLYICLPKREPIPKRVKAFVAFIQNSISVL